MDDLIIYSSSWEDHVEHTRKVRGAGLTANPAKCHWGGIRMEFLSGKAQYPSLSIGCRRWQRTPSQAPRRDSGHSWEQLDSTDGT